MMKNIYIEKSVIHGRGLFTANDLKEGDIIICQINVKDMIKFKDKYHLLWLGVAIFLLFLFRDYFLS